MIAPTDAELNAIVAEYVEDRSRPVVAPARPFLIVTPLGRSIEAAIDRELAAVGVSVASRAALRDWSRLATALYTPRTDRSRMVVAFAFARVWAEHPETAAVWWLGGDHDYGRLIAAKAALRSRFPSRPVRIATPVAARDVELHPFHVPDRERLAAEHAIVAAYV